MTDPATDRSMVGAAVIGRHGRRLGSVDAVFVDYLLVRTAGLVPVDLYLPIEAASVESDGRLLVAADADEAYARWHRPLRSVAHD